MGVVDEEDEIFVRVATAADYEGISAVARAHGFDEADSGVDGRYLDFVTSHGRLVVAVSPDGDVVGFGGAVETGGARLVSDLFVLDVHQGRGIGARMLASVVDGAHALMTFSSDHPRALPAYERVGMQPRWRLDYWSGVVPAEIHRGSTLVVEEVTMTAWRGDRLDLVDHWSERGGALLHLHHDGQLVGWAIVNGSVASTRRWTIDRLATHGSHREAMGTVLSWLPRGAEVLAVVPETSSAGAQLREWGFVVVDHDRCCTTDGTDVPPQVAALHPGLG